MNGDTLRWLKLAKSSKGINSTKAAWMADLGPLKDFLVKEATKSASITEIRKTVCLFIFYFWVDSVFFSRNIIEANLYHKNPHQPTSLGIQSPSQNGFMEPTFFFGR